MVEPRDAARISLNPIGTPLPLTLAGLTIASAAVSGSELDWIPKPEHHTLGWIIVAIPIPLQLLAAWWGFVARSSAAATGSGILAAAWIATGIDLIHTPPQTGPSHALGLTAGAIGATLLVPAAAELHVGGVLPSAVLTLASVRFFIECVAGATHAEGWTDASGWVGLVVAASALYAALALELEGTTNVALLPVFRAKLARRALEEPFEAQLAPLRHEPGVRRQL